MPEIDPAPLEHRYAVTRRRLDTAAFVILALGLGIIADSAAEPWDDAGTLLQSAVGLMAVILGPAMWIRR